MENNICLTEGGFYMRNIEILQVNNLQLKNNTGFTPGFTISYPSFSFFPLNYTNQRVELYNI